MKRPLFKAAAFVAALVAGAWLHAAPPPNDNLDAPQVLTGDSGELTADITEATREDAEDYLDFSSSQHTVWYKWTASRTGFVSFDTLESDFDTVLAAYIDINSGFVARNDDRNDVYEDNTSRIAFLAQAGQTYLIRAGGYAESYGQLTLRWSLVEVQELTLTGDSGALISDISEEGDDDATYKVYKWTAEKTGPAYFKLKSDGAYYETELTVYTNSNVVVEYGSSSVAFCAQAGQTYVILATLWDYEGDCQKQTIVWNGELAEGEWRIIAADGIVLAALGDLPKDFKASDFPAGVTEIADYAFREADGIKFVTIPASVKKIGKYAFADSDLDWVDYEGDAAAIDVSDYAFIGTPYSLELPFKLIIKDGVYTNEDWNAEYTVATTNLEAYSRVVGFLGICPEELVIPEGVTEVAERAFSTDTSGNESLVKVVFPSTLQWVDWGAFSGCDALEQVVGIPQTAEVSEGAFRGSLYEKVRPFELVTYYQTRPDYDSYDYEIGMYTRFTTNMWVSGFHGTCPEEVTIPEGVYGINSSVFSLNGSSSYGDWRSAVNLKKVILPSTLKAIDGYAFSYLPDFEEAVFRGKKEDIYIGDYAFYGTPYMENQPEETQPFELRTEYVSNGYWDYDKGEYVSTSNLYVTGFVGTPPESIVIPDGVYGIRWGVFRGLEGVTAVTIPASVREINDYAFAQCANLATVTFKGKKEEINAYREGGLAWAFFGTPYGETFDFQVLYNIYPSTVWHYEPVYDKEYGSWTVNSVLSETTNCYVYGYVGTCPAKLDLSQLLTNKSYYVSYDFDTVVFSENAFAGTDALTELVLPKAKYYNLTESYSYNYYTESASSCPYVFYQYYSDSKAFRYCPNLATVTIAGEDANNKKLLTDMFQGTPWLDKAVPFEFITEDVVNVRTNFSEEVVGACNVCEPCKWKVVTNEITTTTKHIVGFYGNVPSKLTFPEDVGEIDAVYYWKSSGYSYSLKGGMFEGCENLTEVVVPGNVKRIAQRTVAQCANLQNVEFEEGVESIGSDMFYGSGNDMQVILPASAVAGYYDPDTDEWHGGEFYYAGVFNGIVGDVDVVAPRTTSIYDRAFHVGNYFGRTCVEYYTRVVLDANGGTFEGDAEYRCFDDVLTGLPTPTLAGSVFRGWWDDEDMYENGYVWGENDAQVYLKAEWAKERKFTVLGLLGGTEVTLGEGDDYHTLLRVLEEMYGAEPQSSRHGLAFRYWMVDGVELNHRSEIGENSTFGAFFDEFNPLSNNPEAAIDAAAAQTYDGYILDYKGNNAGTIQVKVGKPNKKTGEARISATAQLFGEKKVTYKAEPKGSWKIETGAATKGVTLFSAKVKDKIVIDISEKGIFGTFGDYDVIGSRNTSKKDAAYASWSGRKYDVAFKTKEGTGSAFTGGYSGVTVSIANKGKVKITGVMADGAKVNASAQLLIADSGEGCVNAFVPMYTGKKGGFGFVLWISPDGATASVESISTWTSTDRKAPFTAELELVGSAVPKPASAMTFALESEPAISGATVLADFLPKAVAAAFDGRKITVAKANKITLDRKTGAATRTGETDNDAALKLTYTAKTGSFKGSFTVYTLVNGRLKKVKANVNGTFVGGEGYGAAVIKNVGSFPVTLR